MGYSPPVLPVHFQNSKQLKKETIFIKTKLFIHSQLFRPVQRRSYIQSTTTQWQMVNEFLITLQSYCSQYNIYCTIYIFWVKNVFSMSRKYQNKLLRSAVWIASPIVILAFTINFNILHYTQMALSLRHHKYATKKNLVIFQDWILLKENTKSFKFKDF